MEEKNTSKFKCPKCGTFYDCDLSSNFSFSKTYCDSKNDIEQSKSCSVGTSLTKYFYVEICSGCGGKGWLKEKEQKCDKCAGSGNFCKEIIN